jgi:hypothetical protein
MKNLFGLFLLVGVLPFWVFYFQEYHQNFINLESSIVTAEKTLKIKKEKLKILKEKTISEQEKKVLLNKIPVKDRQAALIILLRKLVSKHSYNFHSIDFDKGLQTEIGATQINIQFSIEGPLNKLVGFISDIEKNKRFLGIEGIGFSIKNNSANNLSMVINLFAFSQENYEQ